jgi:hypothetical protein
LIIADEIRNSIRVSCRWRESFEYDNMQLQADLVHNLLQSRDGLSRSVNSANERDGSKRCLAIMLAQSGDSLRQFHEKPALQRRLKIAEQARVEAEYSRQLVARRLKNQIHLFATILCAA